MRPYAVAHPHEPVTGKYAMSLIEVAFNPCLEERETEVLFLFCLLDMGNAVSGNEIGRNVYVCLAYHANVLRASSRVCKPVLRGWYWLRPTYINCLLQCIETVGQS